MEWSSKMNSITYYLNKFYNSWFLSKNEEPVVENEDVAVILPISGKRRPEENIQEDMLKKRKKLLPPASAKSDADPCLSSYLSKGTISEYQKENQRMASENLKINQVLRRQKSPRLSCQEVYCIDDEDFDVQIMRNDSILPGGMTLRNRNQTTNLARSSSSDDCMIVGETFRTYSRPKSCNHLQLVLPKVQSIRERNTLMSLFQNHSSTPRTSIPLTNSTIHNTKLNRSVPDDSKMSCFYRSRSFNHSALSPKTKSFLNPPVKPDDSAYDKVVNVIDLTMSEDDEDQRQAIESDVISSSEIQNMKSSFVANDTFALDEDLIPSLTKKFNNKIKNLQTKADQLKKELSDHNEEVTKSISEILEKRLTLKEHVETEDVAQKSSMEVAPITKEMISEINGILASKKSPLVQIKDTSVKIQDIRTLENTSWLNDEIINAYMNLIKLRSEGNPKKYPKVHCFNTFLYEQLSKKGYTSVRRWTRKVDIFDFEILIIPIHLGNHWCLTQIRFQEKLILYYDSMGSPNNRCLNTMMQYLVDEYKDKKQRVFDTSNWTLRNVPYEELPQQKNAHDCGVFACTFAEHLTRNAPLNFDQDHMKYFRIKMMYEILTGRLLL